VSVARAELVMLDRLRPRTRGECLEDARPCPFAACKWHLAIEVADPRATRNGERRPTKMRLNHWPADARVAFRRGRRPGLSSSAAATVVRRWIDDAVTHVMTAPATCALDVIDENPDGLYCDEVAELLDCNEQNVDKIVRRALRKLAAAGVSADVFRELAGVRPRARRIR
jgi:hypothetical protein